MKREEKNMEQFYKDIKTIEREVKLPNNKWCDSDWQLFFKRFPEWGF
jgi:hypothetical protein